MNKKRRFKRIYIEITNTCNLDCSFCPKTSRKSAFMSAELFNKILCKIKDYGKYLYFHVMGEPLLHPDLNNFLDLCGKEGFHANITTNGTLINKNKASLISNPALRLINFSLHSFESNPSNQPIDSYINDILNFIASANQQNPKLINCLRLWNYTENLTNSSNQYILKRLEEFFKYPLQIREIPETGNGLKIADNVYVNQARSFKWPDNKIPIVNSNGFCLGLRDQIAILVDGTVVPCCLDSEGTINLGNIADLTMAEILNSKRAVNLFEGFSSRKLIEPLCRKCGYRTRFDQVQKISP